MTPIAGANELCRLLWAAHYDAFCMSNSAALLFMRSTKSFQATVVVLGERVAPESQRSSNSCTAVFGDKNNVHYYSMVRSSAGGEKLLLAISNVLSGAEVLRFTTEDSEMWAKLFYTTNCKIRDVLKVMHRYHSILNV